MKTLYIYLQLSIGIFCSIGFGSCIGQSSINVSEIRSSEEMVQLLTENNHKHIDDRISLYHQIKKDNPKAIDPSTEDLMNMYGYSLLWEDKIKDALEVFKLLVSEFPNSSNVYDSLAETYLRMENKELALANYQKALLMDPGNFNAEDQIEMIKFPNKKKLTSQEKFAHSFSVQQYRDDIDQLCKTLTNVHPNATKFIDENDFNQLIASKKSLITPSTTYGEFMWHCSEIIASINCSHTSMGRFYTEHEAIPTESRFPLQVRWIDNALYVTNVMNNGDKIQLKDEILSINGTSVQEIIDDIYKHISSQGYVKTTKKHQFNRWSTSMIPYAMNFPEVYSLQVKGKQSPIILAKAEATHDPVNDNSIADCGSSLCLDILSDNKSAIMTISSFNYYRWNRFTEFEQFIDKSIKKLNAKNISNLIIDVRFNGGGSPESSIHLLKYLIDEPFIYYSLAGGEEKEKKSEGEETQIPFENGFQGKLFFIIDGNGNSTTGHFMSMVKKYNLGTIVGEELGSNQFCNAGQKRSRLTNTKLEYNVANNTHISTATSLPDEVGILPDHYVSQSIDQYMDKIDAVKNFTLDLIDQTLAANEERMQDLLQTPDNWGKETFQFPIRFARDIPYEGIEEAYFPPDWLKADSTTFWSYAFVWKIDHNKTLSQSELTNDLKLYFDGLNDVENRKKKMDIDYAVVEFDEADSQSEINEYLGALTIYDRFTTKKPMTLNFHIEQELCKEDNQLMVLFRFAPKKPDHKVWSILKEIKFQDNICTY